MGKIDDLLLAVLLAVLLHFLELEIITSAKIECLVIKMQNCAEKKTVSHVFSFLLLSSSSASFFVASGSETAEAVAEATAERIMKAVVLLEA